VHIQHVCDSALIWYNHRNTIKYSNCGSKNHSISMINPPTTRPYNSYNLFFQLEREYILQTLLGFQPTITSNDIFDPADKTYPAEGPPLPFRYKNLILPYDWHIPGKTRRHKRSHRKSHGKIGFHELNKQISTAWSIVDNDSRNFCDSLADIESRKYKKVKRKKTDKKKVKRKRNKGKTTVATLIKTEPKDDDCSDLSPSFDWTVNFPKLSQDELTKDIPFLDPFLDDNNMSSSKMCRTVSHESVREEQEYLSRASNHRESFTEVDMEDDEIIEIWKTTAIEDDIPPIFSPYCQMCVEIVNPTATNTHSKEDKKEDDTRKSFIDAKYEKFMEIGKQFSTKPKVAELAREKSFCSMPSIERLWRWVITDIETLV